MFRPCASSGFHYRVSQNLWNINGMHRALLNPLVLFEMAPMSDSLCLAESEVLSQKGSIGYEFFFLQVFLICSKLLVCCPTMQAFLDLSTCTCRRLHLVLIKLEDHWNAHSRTWWHDATTVFCHTNFARCCKGFPISFWFGFAVQFRIPSLNSSKFLLFGLWNFQATKHQVESWRTLKDYSFVPFLCHVCLPWPSPGLPLRLDWAETREHCFCGEGLRGWKV